MNYLNQFLDTPYGTLRMWVSKDDINLDFLIACSSWGGYDKEEGDAVSFEFPQGYAEMLERLGYTKLTQAHSAFRGA